MSDKMSDEVKDLRYLSGNVIAAYLQLDTIFDRIIKLIPLLMDIEDEESFQEANIELIGLVDHRTYINIELATIVSPYEKLLQEHNAPYMTDDKKFKKWDGQAQNADQN